MEKDDVIRKIKHCLALSKSDNPTEAATALRQAQRLMQMYDVSALDVSMADVCEAKAKAGFVSIVNWEAELAAMIAAAFGCNYFSQHSNAFKGFRLVKEHHYVFVGVGAAADVAQYAFEVLLRQCIKARKAHIAAQRKNCKSSTKTARGDVFAGGWVDGVYRLVGKFSGNEQHGELISQYVAQKYPVMKKADPKDRATGKNTNDDSYWAGKVEARNAQLNRGMGTQQQERLT